MTTASPDRAPGYVAHTEAIDDPGDLLDHLGPGGFAWLNGESTGFVTAGVVDRFPLRRAAATLAAISHVRDASAPIGAGPRAFGALAFEGDGDLVLPSRIVSRDTDGRSWRTTIEGTDAPHALHVPYARPTEFAVRSRVDVDEWRARLAYGLAAIDAGEIEKVVLAREVDIEADAPFDVVDILDTLRATQPGCIVYATDGFVGASPELLVRRAGREVTSRPMAGTGDDPAALLASTKDAHEHRIVVDAIVAALRDRCDAVRCEGPSAVRFATVTHLATTIRGRLVDPDVRVTDLVELLHPTPAVGGWPAQPARTMIRTLEGHDRGRYAGACGWVDTNGDGEFVVALRCAQLDGSNARLYAGAGIVAGSEPGAEWAETQAKLQPMLRALVRP
jgi:menaquinone-specific isochorismate synthase